MYTGTDCLKLLLQTDPRIVDAQDQEGWLTPLVPRQIAVAPH